MQTIGFCVQFKFAATTFDLSSEEVARHFEKIQHQYSISKPFEVKSILFTSDDRIEK
jgi:hypothetical protein